MVNNCTIKEYARLINRKLKNSELVTLEGTGHEIHPADWDIIIDSISRHVTTAEGN